MADLTLQSTRVIDQGPEVVHDRLLELAERLRDELPPVERGTQAANVLGVSGRLPLEIGDRGPGRIEVRTTDGRIRGQAAADLAPTADGKTKLTLSVAVEPQGFAANMMLGAAVGMVPGGRERIVDRMERAFDDLAVELAKPDRQWDARAWTPPGLPVREPKGDGGG